MEVRQGGKHQGERHQGGNRQENREENQRENQEGSHGENRLEMLAHVGREGHHPVQGEGGHTHRLVCVEGGEDLRKAKIEERKPGIES